MNNNKLIVSLNVNVDELNAILSSLSKHEEFLSDLKERLFADGNRQLEILNRPIIESPVVLNEGEEVVLNDDVNKISNEKGETNE
jgi:hypothetical protein